MQERFVLNRMLDKNDIVANIDEKFGYHFHNTALLIESLTHPSLGQVKLQNYERLEFLGDAILNVVITEFIFKNLPLAAEGNLAKFRAYLVSKDTLALIAQRLNLGNFILMTEGEESSGGRVNKNNLENVLESLIGAIYLDSNIDTIKGIILKLWHDELHTPYDFMLDPKTLLQEWSQSRFGIKPTYTVIDKSGASHDPIFTVLVSINECNYQGCGSSIKAAQKNAAFGFIKAFGIDESHRSNR